MGRRDFIRLFNKGGDMELVKLGNKYYSLHNIHTVELNRGIVQLTFIRNHASESLRVGIEVTEAEWELFKDLYNCSILKQVYTDTAHVGEINLGKSVSSKNEHTEKE